MSITDQLKELFGIKNDSIQTLRLSEPQNVKRAYEMGRIGVGSTPYALDTSRERLDGWSRRNELVYACIEKIKQAAIDPSPIVERRKKDDEWEAIPGHPLTRLLNRPNSMEDGASFFGAWLASEHIFGEAFAEIERNEIGQPSSLWLLNPLNMKPVPGRGKNGSPIVAYEYTEGGEMVRLKAEDVLVRRNKDLTNRFFGLSPLQIALGAIDMDTAQTDFVRAFFTNGGVPSGILSFKEHRLTAEQAQEKREAWMRLYGRGGQHNRGVAVLDQTAEYQKIGSSLNELESDSLRFQSESRICSVFGVPPALVGAYVGLRLATNNATMRVHMEDFWINKMSPLFKSLRTFLNWNLLPEFERIELIEAEQIRVSWDMSKVMALQEDTDKHQDRARKNFQAGGITLNEFRTMIGEQPDAEGDYYLRPSMAVPQTPEVAFIEAEKVPQQPAQLTGETVDGEIIEDDEEEEKRDEVGTVEQKKFEIDGIELSREPNEREQHLDLKAMVQAFESHSELIEQTLGNLRKTLITQAVEEVSVTGAKELPAVALVPPPKVYGEVKSKLKKAFAAGRAQIARELSAQKNSPSEFQIKADEFDAEESEEIEQLSEITIARVINDVQTKAISIAAALTILGIFDEALKSRLEKDLSDSSVSFLRQAARNAANRAINLGRKAEATAREDEWETVQYSALLDANCCDSCKEADGEEAKRAADLTPAPNQDCDGYASCRCFHVYISK